MRALFTDGSFYLLLVAALLSGMAIAARRAMEMPGGNRLKVLLVFVTAVIVIVLFGRHTPGVWLLAFVFAAACALIGAALVSARRAPQRFIMGRWHH